MCNAPRNEGRTHEILSDFAQLQTKANTKQGEKLYRSIMADAASLKARQLFLSNISSPSPSAYCVMIFMSFLIFFY
jgi:hypothetical protein